MASQVQNKTLPTIWEVPSVLWSIVSEILVQTLPSEESRSLQSLFPQDFERDHLSHAYRCSME